MGTPNISGGSLKSTLSGMGIGDYINCEYTATSNTAGTFANLGTSVKSEIATTGTATPNGKFYFIKVDKGIYVSDRVIQTGVSWDVLNAGNYIEGKSVTFDTVSVKIRSMTGGTVFVNENGNPTTLNRDIGSYPSKNEWDTFIVNSTLNGKITAGSNSVWNWSNGTTNLNTWTSDSPSASFGSYPSNRVTRGYGQARTFNGTSDYISFSSKIIPIGAKTITFNIKTTGTSNGWKNILNTRGNGTGFICYMNQNTGILAFAYGTAGVGGYTNYYIGSPSNINDNQWHQVKFEYDGTTNANGLKLYIDNMTTPVAYAKASAVETTQSFNLFVARAAEYSGDFFSGSIDELKIFNSNNALVFYLPSEYFTDSTTVAKDMSGNGYDGTVTGTTFPDNAKLNGLGFPASSTVSASNGFRPVLIY